MLTPNIQGDLLSVRKQICDMTFREGSSLCCLLAEMVLRFECGRFEIITQR